MKSLAFDVDSANAGFTRFIPISKVEKNKDGTCTVSGYASTPSLDLDGEIVTIDAIKAAMPGYWEYANIREMHQPKAAGVGIDYKFDDGGWFLRSRISDPVAVQKCLDRVYKGYSIGGRKISFDLEKSNVITGVELIEVSLVDRPANPDCKIALAKRAKDATEGAYLLKAVKPSRDPKAKALTKMAQAVNLLSKVGPAPDAPAINPPAARDGFSLPAPGPNRSPKDGEVQNNKAGGACEEHGVIGCTDCMDKRDFDAEQRRDAASAGDALPDGSFPIKNQKDLDNAWGLRGNSKHSKSTVVAHIRAQAKKHGLKMPEKKDKKKESKKLAKKQKLANLARFVPPPLGKRMSTAGSLSYSFDSIRDAQRSLLMEAEREGGDKKDAALAKELGNIAHDLGSVISQKALHESEESLDLSDCDDEYIRNLLESNSMDKSVSNGSVPSLDTAILNMLKRSMMPSKESRMKSAQENLGKARKARKTAEEEIKNCYSAISKRYMAKMAKAAAKDKKPDDDDDEMAETEKVLKSLQKAHGALTTMKTFIKAADSHLEKAAARSGERGQEVNDPSGSGTPTGAPAGLKDLSPGEMASAGGGGQPPMYPDDGGVYPGKFAKLADKNGMVSAGVMEMIAENARLEGQMAIMGKVTQPTGSRPYAFDVSKVYGNENGNGGFTPPDRRQNDILLNGVDPQALQSGDENVRNRAAATVAGNYLMSGTFGKSIVDPNFRGKAGMGPGR